MKIWLINMYIFNSQLDLDTLNKLQKISLESLRQCHQYKLNLQSQGSQFKVTIKIQKTSLVFKE